MGRSALWVRARPSARLRRVVVGGVLLLLLLWLLLSRSGLHGAPGGFFSPSAPPPVGAASWERRNPSLTACECAAAFPGLTREVDRAVAEGPFVLDRPSSTLGPLIARIRDGKLFILQATARVDLSEDMLQHRSATLHQIANALLTAPHPEEVPDTIMAFNHRDEPLPRTFSYCRPADATHEGAPGHYFPVPHFAAYAWPLAPVGSYSRAAAAVAALEANLTWADKRPRAVWRGTAGFNGARAGRLRPELLATTRGHAAWADVEALRPPDANADADDDDNNNNDNNNALAIEDFCRYRYIVHTEGVTYSGRLPFHQLCASVVLTPPLAWPLPLAAPPLLRPAFSADLPGVVRTPRPGADLGRGVREKTAALAPYPAPWVADAWPDRHDAATDANVVFVAPDWSDLGATVAWLEANPSVAQAIASRQRQLFHGGGYYSPAAEMCYWRAAIRGWASMVRFDAQGFDDMKETPWEEFNIKEIHR